MFFYISLFIASVVAAIIILYVYNAIVDVGKQVYRSFLPSSKRKFKNKATNHVSEPRYTSTINDTPTPWGWQSHATPANTARTHPAPASSVDNTPWGWKAKNQGVHERGAKNGNENSSGLDGYLKKTSYGSEPAATPKPTVGWPYREEKSEMAGKAYKVKRATTFRRTNLKETSTPWGW
jgi:hypothetical protein